MTHPQHETEHAASPAHAIGPADAIAGASIDADADAATATRLSPREREQLLHTWNATDLAYPDHLCLHQLFERQAHAHPDAPALVHAGESVSYAQLNARANRLAHRLIRRGLRPDQRVALCVRRGPAMVVGVLAVLKAGGAYVPFDPGHASARLGEMLGDCAPELLLADDSGRAALGDTAVRGLSVIDPDIDTAPGEDDRDPQLEHLAAHHLAYVIYTSGSTGAPKGVMIEHRNAVHLAHTRIARLRITPHSRVAQFASLAFDASVLEMIMALSSGAALYLPTAHERESAEAWFAWMNREAITHALLPPAFVHGPRPRLQHAPVLMFGGEAPSPTLIASLATQATLVNAYGPTEITVCASMWIAPDEATDLAKDLDRVPIGRPLANTRLYLLDAQRQPVALGEVGELYIGGAGVARGYLHRPELSAERFLPDPFSPHPGARMYRSGDLARYRADGHLLFVGRDDDQIKLRGHRIELGEIQARLSEHPEVRDCVVIARADASGETRLIAYCIADADTGATLSAQLRAHLSERLPAYMIPAAFVVLDAFALTGNGKIDRHALPAPHDDAFARAEFHAPQGATETALAQWWQSLLGIERVGRDDHFFALGGHSLTATRLLTRVRERFGVALPATSVFAHPRLADLAVEIERYPAQAQALPALVAVAREGALPLSFAQQRLWFLAQLDSADTRYNMPLLLDLHGDLDTDALQRALDGLFARHDSLRTIFRALDGQAQVWLLPADAAPPMVHHDLRDAVDAAAQLERLSRIDADTPFDLSAGPLIRARLLRIGEDHHRLIVTQHHIVCDGWSMDLLARELSALYAAARESRADPLPPLSLQYPDYAAWEQRTLTAERLRPHADYWREALADAPAALALPTDRPHPPRPSFAADALPLRLDAALTDKLKRLSRSHDATLFMTVAAAWASVLSRLSGQDDVVIGAPSANRDQAQIEPLIGFFVNTLALRIDLSGEPDAAQLLRRVRDAALGAQAHQALPFEQVVEIVQPARRIDRAPVFQVLLAWQSNRQGVYAMPGLRVSARQPFDAIRFELELHLHEHDGCIVGHLGYATSLFDRATIERHLGYLRAMLEAMCEHAAQPIAGIALLPAREREHVLEGFNRTRAEHGDDACVHALFEQQARQHGDAIALIHDHRRLSYAELNARANRLAHRLIALGVGPDDRVALCAERGVPMVVGLLAALKAGAAYVPLDLSYPRERLTRVLGDARPAAVLCDASGRGVLGESALCGQRVLDLDADDGADAAADGHDRDPHIAGLDHRHLAYVLYTSGSTGTPKGVAMPHAPLVNLLRWQRSQFAPRQRVLQFAAIGFDVAFQEIFGALCAGGSVVLIDARTRLDFARLIGVLGEHRVERVHLPYIATQSLAEAVDALDDAALAGLRRHLREVIVAGEQLRLTAQIRRLFERLPECRLHNHYGPTETHVATACVFGPGLHDVPAHAPIGRPIDNARVYLLDRFGQPVPMGTVGELYIGGVGIARGYLNRDDLSEQRFLADPFAGAPARMYRTGDLARHRADGTLVYVGRNDQQLKIRGFRIEPGEIEARLAEYPGVLECAVIAREDAPGQTRLVAYLVADGNVAAEDFAAALRAHLSARLPDYMLPAAFVAMRRLPVTPNGKLDTRALPAPSAEAFARDVFAAPQSPSEIVLAGLWQELLAVEGVGRDDDFFRLGGHSLIAVRLLSRIGAAFAIDLPLDSLFAHPRLADLASAIDACVAQGRAIAQPPIAPRTPDADADTRGLPLSFAQQRLWFLSRFHESSAHYHVPLALRLRGELDRAALRTSLDRLFARHEGLRSVFVGDDGHAHVEILPAQTGVPLTEHDLRGMADAAERMRRTLAEAIDAPFRLDRGPLLRACLIRLDQDEHVFVLVQHHIVSDGWSLQVLMRELSALYAACRQRRPDPLPPLALQYPDYALWQREWLQGERVRTQTDYWRQALRDAPALLDLPLDRPRPPQQSFQAGFVALNLEPALAQGLKRIGREHGTTLFMTVLAAWSVVLARLSGQDDVVIGVATAGRTRRELEPLVGFFVNTLALRIDLSGEPCGADLLARVRRTTLDAQAHQDLPFEQVVESLHLPRRLDRTPLFQVMFAWQNDEDAVPELDGLHTQAEPFAFEWSKFDLELVLGERDGGIAGGLNYSAALFDPASIERHRDYLLAALRALVADTAVPVARIDLLSAPERSLQLDTWNRTEAGYERDCCVHQWFERQVRRDPQALAVFHDGATLSYAELNARANRLAHRLIELGVRPDDRVALCAQRGFALLAGLLAILKAGAAYLPFDPVYASARVARMLDDAAPVLALCDGVGREALSGAAGDRLRIVDLSDDPAQSRDYPDTDPCVPGLNSRHLAYVIYTSGSTGAPKGVMVEHRNFMHLLAAQSEYLQLSTHSRVMQATSIGFDASVFDLAMAFAHGGALYLPSASERDSAPGLLAYMDRHRITHATVPPALLQGHTPPPFATRPTVLVGGEAPHPAMVRELSRHATVINAYGPTEITVCATVWTASAEALEADPDTIPIGRPLRNTRLYLLDRHGQPLPTGAVGELYIGGAGVARGYLNQPALTAERFLPDPFSGQADARMYRSGDLARYRADGNLVFVGRNDGQIKLRGFRIELGEIQARLSEHPWVRDCAVLARQDTPGETRLVAYVVAAHDRDRAGESLAATLRAHLSERLPDYMVPAALVAVPDLPLTVSGKLDRSALPAPDDGDFARGEWAAPQGEREIRLAGLWQTLLGLERVGRFDHFFELGGHSLRAVHLAARISQAFGVQMPVREVFAHPVLKDMAAHLQPASAGTDPAQADLDLAAQVQLDPAIHAANASTPASSDARRHVLLTGASGFLGSFLLDALLRHDDAVVHCLIRCRDLADGRRRLDASLAALGLPLNESRERVLIVPGDLSQPRLGLSAQEFAALAERIHAIYHNGAWVNSLHRYETLKPANVSGTQEVLRLASTGPLKHVHYISTLSTMPTVDALDPAIANGIVEEEQLFAHWRGLHGGYAQSKWVAEQLLRLGGARGIPFTVYRPGHIAGSSRDGACNLTDTWSLFLGACLTLGHAPDLDLRLNSLPVDRMSAAIVALSRRDDIDGRSLNLTHPDSYSLKDWIDAMLPLPGMSALKLPYSQWHALCAANEATARVASILPPDFGPEPTPGAAYGRVRLSNAIEEWIDDDGIRAPLDVPLLRRYAQWLYRHRDDPRRNEPA